MLKLFAVALLTIPMSVGSVHAATKGHGHALPACSDGQQAKQPVYAAVRINRILVRIVQKTNGATAVRAPSSRASRTRWTEKGPVSRSGARGPGELSWAG